MVLECLGDQEEGAHKLGVGTAVVVVYQLDCHQAHGLRAIRATHLHHLDRVTLGVQQDQEVPGDRCSKRALGRCSKTALGVEVGRLVQVVEVVDCQNLREPQLGVPVVAAAWEAVSGAQRGPALEEREEPVEKLPRTHGAGDSDFVDGLQYCS